MATIIRKGEERETASGSDVQAIAFSFADMRGRANDYLEIVRAEAAKIVQQAHREAERIRRQAEAAGRKAAEVAVDRMLEEKIAKRMDTLLPALERTAAQLDDAKGELLRQWEAAAIRVATAIAQRIIHRELAREPVIALDIIAETLRLAAGAGEISVQVNASDYEHLGDQIDRLAGTICHVAPAQIVADPEISPGGCRVTTKFGSIDQQIETQLRRIEEDLR
jgi:flagellar biosynthesis/type III secretory pathway protein FliH